MTRRVFTLVLVVLATITAAGQTGTARTAFETARKVELIDGNLDAAIARYKMIVGKYGTTDRAVAAEALLQLAGCYQKQGNAEARKIYEQIVREYADQTTVSAQARAELRPIAAAGNRRANPRQRLCSDCVSDFNGTFVTPDGRFLYYTADHLDIERRDLASGAVTRMLIPKTGTGQRFVARFPAVSPDASQLAFRFFDRESPHSQLMVMANRPGAEPRVLIDNPELPFVQPIVWSPDGRRLLVEIERPDETWQYGWITAQTKELTILKSLGWRHEYDFKHRPALSPDGKFVAYAALVSNPPRAGAPSDPPGQRIYVIAADGSSEVAVTDTAADYGFPTWTTNGTLVFTSSRGTADIERQSLWALATKDGRASGIPRLIAQDVGSSETQLSGISATDVLYYRVIPSGIPQIAISEVGAGGATTQQAPQTFAGFEPAWSPDGKSISHLTSGFSKLTVRTLATGEERSMNLPAGMIMGTISWAHNRPAIFAVSQQEDAIVRIDLPTGATSTTTLKDDCCLLQTAALATDDQTVYFVAGTTNNSAPRRIVGVDVTTAQVRPVLTLPSTGTTSWVRMGVSPNGKRFALASVATPSGAPFPFRLSVINADGSGYREIDAGSLLSANRILRLSWTTEAEVAVTTVIKGGRQIVRVPIDGAGDPTVMTEPSNAVALSPDRSRVASVVYSDEADDELWSFDLTSLVPLPR